MKHNKAFKWDSCRVAFLVCGDFCGESGLRKVGLGGTHPLTQRYISKRNQFDIYVFTDHGSGYFNLILHS
ncbi:hypothetical protein ACH0R5_004402 [Vibrio vulnificus]